MTTDAEIYSEFISECEEHLASVEGDLLQLESTTAEQRVGLVNSLFRVMHSIKGGAGFLGFTGISALAHDLESILSLISNGELDVGSDVVDALLAGSDLLMKSLTNPDSLEQNKASNTQQRLQVYLAGGIGLGIGTAAEPLKDSSSPDTAFEDTTPSTKSMEPVPSTAAVGTAPSAPVASSVTADLPAGAGQDYEFELSFDLDAATEAEFVRQRDDVLERLRGETTILQSQYGAGKSAGEPGWLHVQVRTWLEADFLAVVAGIPETQIKRITSATDRSTHTGEVAASQTSTTDPSPAPAHPAKTEANTSSAVSPPGEVAETMRIKVGLVDTLMNLAGELVSLRNQFLRNVQKSDSTMRAIAHGLDTVTLNLQESIMATRMQPMDKVFGRLPRLVRETMRTLGKEIRLELIGGEVELDKTILEALIAPVAHLIRNCCDHGIESPMVRERIGKPRQGTITVRAYHEGGQINIEITDDGAGIDLDAVKAKAVERGLRSATELERLSDQDVYRLLFQPGFSTAKQLSEVSGRGVGLDVVRAALVDIGGETEIRSELGQGTTFQLRLPLTLAIMPCLVVGALGDRFAIPQVNVVELFCLYDDQIQNQVEFSVDREVFHLRNRLVQLTHLSDVLSADKPFTTDDRAAIIERHRRRYQERLDDQGASATQEAAGAVSEPATAGSRLNIVLLRVGSTLFGLVVDQIFGSEEIVVKPMHSRLKHLECYSGATVMGDGEVVLTLDVPGISRYTGIDMVDNDRQKEEFRSVSEIEKYLLFDRVEQQQFAARVNDIQRVVRLEAADIFNTERGYMTEIDETVIPAYPLDAEAIAKSIEIGEPLFLLLAFNEDELAGILVRNLDDIVTPSGKISRNHQEPPALGTAMVDGRMTLFLDLPGFLAQARRGTALKTVPPELLIAEPEPIDASSQDSGTFAN